MKNLSMSSTMTERTPPHCYDTGVTPQQCYEGGGVTNYSEKRSPSTSQVLAIITGLHVGCILLALAGLFLLGTLTGLVVTTPLFILFSPVLVPATIVIGLAVAGFLMSAVFGLTALSSLSWAMKYIRQTQGTVAEQLELEKQCMAKWWSEWCNMKVFFIFITKAAIRSLSFSLDPHNHRFNTTTAKTTRRFLTNSELTTMQHLESFLYSQTIKSGSIWIRVMRDNEIDPLVCLLADTFAEMMIFPKSYINMLRFLLKQNLIKRRTLMPHMATLIGFYRGVVDGEEDEEMQLAGTVEICFDKNGANSSLPSPTPPKDSPYISSVAVDKSFRRWGIGRHLLKASEELISRICLSGEVYLHCRMTDEAPFNMYTKADYKIVTTDSILVLVMLERRNHLMCKKLPLISMPSEIDVSCSDDNE